MFSTSSFHLKVKLPVGDAFADTSISTCAYLDADNAWSTEGVRLATNMEVAATLNLESVSGVWCVTYHLSIFAGFIDLCLV